MKMCALQVVCWGYRIILSDTLIDIGLKWNGLWQMVWEQVTMPWERMEADHNGMGTGHIVVF